MSKLFKPSQHTTQDGFTLLEMAIVMGVAGVLVASAAHAATQYFKIQKIDKTATAVETVQAALAAYKSAHGALPCPARRDVGRDSFEWGTATNCADTTTISLGSCADGLCIRAGREETPGNFLRVRVGAVPFKSLNIPASATRDGYGNALTYAVTEVLAVDSSTASGHKGGIDVVDGEEVSQLETAGTGEFFLFSHGRDGAGAYAYATGKQTPIACPAGSPEWKNCADTAPATFSAAAYSTAGGVNAADDVFAYSMPDMPQPAASAAIESLTLAGRVACPSGFDQAYQGDYVADDRGAMPVCTADDALRVVYLTNHYEMTANGSPMKLGARYYTQYGTYKTPGGMTAQPVMFRMGVGCTVCTPSSTPSASE